MTARYLDITSKHRQMTGFLASLADFDWTEGAEVDAGALLTKQNLSLYCLDDASKRAIFVELPAGAELTQAPFVYQMQYELAERLIAVPYAEFVRVGCQLPELNHLIMVYVSGRSGSTLLSHILNKLPNVVSLSEPDAATQFVHLRRPYEGNEAELGELLDCTVRFLSKAPPGKRADTYAIKLRNEGLHLMDLYQATFPQVKNLFLYRDCIGYVTSFYRIFVKDGVPATSPVDEILALMSGIGEYDYTPMKAYLEDGTTQVSIVQYVTLWWLAVMEWYLAQYRRGIPVLAVRYADLVAKREQVLTEVFRYCGLPTDLVKETFGAFEQDAQAGTGLARENPNEGNQLKLTPEQRQAVAAILAKHPTIHESDFIVPGTLVVDHFVVPEETCLTRQ